MAKVKRRGDLDGLDHINMKAARKLHRQLCKARAIRRSFRRWFRCEVVGVSAAYLYGKAAVLAGF
jgi:hypothetical protein